MQSPTYYLRDLQKKLSQNRFLDLSESTLHRIFERERFSYKKAEKRAAERDEEEVARFIYSISRYKTAQLSYLDESVFIRYVLFMFQSLLSKIHITKDDRSG